MFPSPEFMPYSEFSLKKVKQTFGVKVIESEKFLPSIELIVPSAMLSNFLEESLPLAIAIGSKKARSELIISPVLLEIRKIFNRQISLFSGAELTVYPTSGLNDICDFIISKSPEQLGIEAPVIVVEAKKTDLNLGIGQCIAEMIAAQVFNQTKGNQISTIYGVVSTGTNWKFLRLKDKTIEIDLNEYFISQLGKIIGILISAIADE